MMNIRLVKANGDSVPLLVQLMETPLPPLHRHHHLRQDNVVRLKSHIHSSHDKSIHVLSKKSVAATQWQLPMR